MTDEKIVISGEVFKLLREAAIVMGKSNYNMVILELSLEYLRNHTPDGHAPKIIPSTQLTFKERVR